MDITPTEVTAGASKNEPTFIYGSLIIIPNRVVAAPAVVDPVLIFSSSIDIPIALGVSAGVVDPTVIITRFISIGNVDCGCATVDPTVAISGVSVAPVYRSAGCSIANPFVRVPKVMISLGFARRRKYI
jgi:hypothetical protein